VAPTVEVSQVQPYSKYEILDVLGSGPRATVHRGRHVDLRVDVAIKQIYPAVNPRTREQLFLAVNRWAQASHPQLLAVLDAYPARGWIVTELMAGNFGDLVARQPVDPRRVQEVLVQSLSALDFLHTRRGCLHANLKPANLLYDSEGRIRLGDGYAIPSHLGIDLPPPTRGCKYLAPEMLGAGSEEIGPAADLYCLGFVVLELLIGPRFDALFRSVSDDPNDPDGAWVRWHLTPSETAPRASDQVAGVPRSLAIVIDRLVCKDLVQRYRFARDVLSDLTPVGEPLRTAPPGPAPRATDDRPAPPARPDGHPDAPSPPPDARAVPGNDFIVAQPATPVVLRLISGPRAGEMLGLSDDEIGVGESDDSRLKFSSEQYPGARGRRIRIRREAQGWMVRAEGAEELIVNQQPVYGEAPLRCGDIIRLSILGPDFQFILHNPGEQSLAELAALFPGPRPPAAGLAGPGPAAAPVRPGSYPTSSPSPVVPVLAPPQGPTPGPSPVDATGSPGGDEFPRSAYERPGGAPPAPPRRIDWRKLLDYKNWDKNTRLWVVGVISVIFAAIVFCLVPVGGSRDKSEPPPKAPAATAPATGDAQREQQRPPDAVETSAPPAQR
jgi:serine/threonine protein kinase